MELMWFLGVEYDQKQDKYKPCPFTFEENFAHTRAERGIFVTSHGQIFSCFWIINEIKSGNELIYGNKNGGHWASKGVSCKRS